MLQRSRISRLRGLDLTWIKHPTPEWTMGWREPTTERFPKPMPSTLEPAEFGGLSHPLADLPSPEPSAGLDAYHRERERCLAASPEKQRNYDLFMSSDRRSAHVDYLPVKLDIENVSRCNFRCIMCVVNDWGPKRKRADDMSLDRFKALIDEQTGLVEIKLQGIGEPLLQGDDFFEMIRYARDRHIWVRTTTNGSLLHLKDNYKKLIDAGTNEIQMSVDGASKEVFETIRRGARFDRIAENCRLINAYGRERRRRVTKMWTVVQRDNFHQVDSLEMVDWAANLGFRDQAFAFSLTDWGREEWRERNDDVTVDEDLTAELGHRLMERGDQLGVKVSFWRVTSKYDASRPETLCPWPFERAMVTSDSRVTPCCAIGDPDSYEFERGRGRDFHAIWNGRAYAAFRKAHLTGNPPPVCRGCYHPS